MPPVGSSGSSSTPKAARPVIHPSPRSEIRSGSNGVTPEDSKEVLGWCEDADTAKEKGLIEPQLSLPGGRKVWLTNNVSNRPIYSNVYNKLKQEMLNRRWSGPNGNGKTVNGEPTIIGVTGIVLNGQHTHIAHVLSEEERTGEQAVHWANFWSGPVVIDRAFVYGVDESDDTVNTMDTCKPRSLADVIYRSWYFRNKKPAERRIASKMLGYAVQQMWNRTGARMDAFAPLQTHSEALNFLDRHQRLLEAVGHIVEENTNRRISLYITPGYASALLYLMAATDTNGERYRGSESPSEKDIDFGFWNKACQFWSLLVDDKDKTLSAVRKVLANLVSAGSGASQEDKFTVLAKAWSDFSSGKPVTTKSVSLELRQNEYGILVLAETVTFGGIDTGGIARGSAPGPSSDPAVVEKRKAEVDAERDKKRKDKAEKVAAELKKRRERKGGKEIDCPVCLIAPCVCGANKARKEEGMD